MCKTRISLHSGFHIHFIAMSGSIDMRQEKGRGQRRGTGVAAQDDS
jgi:hypothetical protein